MTYNLKIWVIGSVHRNPITKGARLWDAGAPKYHLFRIFFPSVSIPSVSTPWVVVHSLWKQRNPTVTLGPRGVGRLTRMSLLTCLFLPVSSLSTSKNWVCFHLLLSFTVNMVIYMCLPFECCIKLIFAFSFHFVSSVGSQLRLPVFSFGHLSSTPCCLDSLN